MVPRDCDFTFILLNAKYHFAYVCTERHIFVIWIGQCMVRCACVHSTLLIFTVEAGNPTPKA